MLLAWAALAFPASPTLAAGRVSLADLSRWDGVWKAQGTHESGEAWISYAVYRKMQAPEVLTVFSYGVDPKSKKVLNSFFGYVGVDPSTNQFTGLYFSDEGWVSRALLVPTGRGVVYQVDTILTNYVRTAATLFEEWESDTVTTMTWKNILENGTFLAQGKPARFVKMSESMRDLRESGAIVFPTDNEPISALAPLKRLAGRWEGKDASGSTYNLAWSWRGSGRWLVERWRISESLSGINVTGIDPSSGLLGLWIIAANDRGLYGTWHLISDNTLGQVEGEVRLLREFADENTFKARWQILKGGGYADAPEDQTGPPYTAKRVSGR